MAFCGVLLCYCSIPFSQQVVWAQRPWPEPRGLSNPSIFGFLFYSAFFCVGAWRCLRGWWKTPRGSSFENALQLGKLLAFGSIVVIGVLVDYRLENLGTMTGAAVLWYLVTAPYSAPERREWEY